MKGAPNSETPNLYRTLRAPPLKVPLRARLRVPLPLNGPLNRPLRKLRDLAHLLGSCDLLFYFSLRE